MQKPAMNRSALISLVLANGPPFPHQDDIRFAAINYDKDISREKIYD